MMKMKKKYIAPQAEIVGGIYDTCILAGSTGDSSSGSTHGSGSEGGNQEQQGGIDKSDGSGLGGGAKEHFNAWTAWED